MDGEHRPPRRRPNARLEQDDNGRFVLVGFEEAEDMSDGPVIISLPPQPGSPPTAHPHGH
jgi:hypothetical protein